MIILVVVLGSFSVYNHKLKVEELKIHEQEATERTEERSQFWQKLIPWGSDESEQSED